MSTLTGELNIVQNLTGELNKNLEYVTPELQEKIATPTKQTQNITPDENYDALSKVVVNPIPNEYIIPNYQTKNVTIVQNGVQEITPDVNYDGLSKVNVTTSIPAPVLQEKTITPTSQTQNVTPDSNYDGLSKVVVNGVSGYVDWSAIGYSGTPQSVIDGYNYAKQIYDNWDSSQTDLSRKYEDNKSLIIMPLVDTLNATNFGNMFSNCSALTYVPLLNTSKATYVGYMFSNCTALTKAPQLNLEKADTLSYMFNNCNALTYVPSLNTLKAQAINNMFNNCSALTDVGLIEAEKVNQIQAVFNNCKELTNFGGFKNLGANYLTNKSENYYNYALYLSACTNLTHDSLMNVINNLYDIATKGCQPQQLVLGNTNLAKLTAEEIAIATNKGWTVS